MGILPIIDCHAHLGDKRIVSNAQQIIAESKARGLAGILVNAAKFDEWDDVLAMYGEARCAIAIQPFFPEEWTDKSREKMLFLLQDKAASRKIAAIGEIGLDCWNGREALPAQRNAFIEQLLIARSFDRPVCIHNRKSWQDFFDVLKFLGISELHGYCHNFTGDKELAKRILKLGLYISFCSPITFPQTRKARETAASIPKERILTETDCPDLPTAQFKGQYSMPFHAFYPLATIAGLRNAPIEEMAQQILHNWQELFAFN